MKIDSGKFRDAVLGTSYFVLAELASQSPLRSIEYMLELQLTVKNLLLNICKSPHGTEYIRDVYL